MSGSSRWMSTRLRSPQAVAGVMVAILGVLPGVLAENLLSVFAGVLLAAWIVLFYRRTTGHHIDRITETVGAGDGQLGIADVADRVERMSGELSDAEQLRAEREATQFRAERLLRQMTAVASGNLATTVEPSEGDLAQLAESFNHVVLEMRALVEQISQASTEVDRESGSFEEVAGRLSSVTSQQSALISTSCEQLDAVRDSIERLTALSSRSVALSQDSRSTVQTGGEAIQETIRVMRLVQHEVESATRIIARLGDSSREIGAIVQFIAQIARQTNTLALNASIQAARAGEHGRGFAVVAEEVRTLAERSSSATRQIGALVSTIQTDTGEAAEAIETSSREVGAGVRIAATAGDSAASIEQVVGEMSGLLEDIERGARLQLTTVTEVSGTMRDLAESSNAVSEDGHLAAESLRSIARFSSRLRESVTTFVTSPAGGVPVAADGDD